MNLRSDIELKIRRFFRKNGKAIVITVIIIIIIITIDRFVKLTSKNSAPNTTFTPNVPILDSNAKVPDKIQKSAEEFIKEYIEYCNNKDYTKAYAMISEECKTEYFGSYSVYVDYIKNKFPTPKNYSIQSYSIYNKKYIYSVKLFDDILATGLTNSSYSFQEEKIVASYDENKNIVFSVGNFIEKNIIQSVQENKYLKVDVKSQIVKYSYEEYKIKLTNRSDYMIIIQNSDDENSAIQINLGQEFRNNELTNNIILKPGETKIINPVFQKFYDDGDKTKEIIFNSVRIIDEQENEIDRMSMKMGL